MLTIICPNCHHRFPPPCCRELSDAATPEIRENADDDEEWSVNGADGCSTTTTRTQNCYTGGFLVPRGYISSGDFTSGGDCFITAPKIIQKHQSGIHCGSTVSIGSEMIEFPCIIENLDNIQPSTVATLTTNATATAAPLNSQPELDLLNNSMSLKSVEYETLPSFEQQHIANTCDLTGGSVTITTHTPDIQSGGCMIQNTDSGVLVQAPHIEIRPKLTGGGCLVQKRLSTENEQLIPNYNVLNKANGHRRMFCNLVPRWCAGCLELPANGDTLKLDSSDENAALNDVCCRMYNGVIHKKSLCQSSNVNVKTNDHGGMQIHVNATVQLPANLGECKLNITATTQSGQAATATKRLSSDQVTVLEPAHANVSAQDDTSTQLDEVNEKLQSILNDVERKDGAPATPLSWLMPYPWSVDTEQTHRDPNRLHEVKKMLQMCGWYHEGISWQQSEILLRDMPVGYWLMRDSSDSRYTFAVSVQTNRGPTSIRIRYFAEGFRFDAEPRMALAMPFFNSPISMLEHYVEYSKKNEQRREVWVDYSGQMYSQIYLTQPLYKNVRPLSHLARLVVNRHKISIEHLPLVMRNYIAEYPYTL